MAKKLGGQIFLKNPVVVNVKQRLKDLHIQDLIRTGSYGAVYNATLDGNPGPVVVKKLHPVLCEGIVLDRFHQEAELLKTFNHENIIKCYEVLTERSENALEIPLLVMEKMDESLRDFIHRRKSKGQFPSLHDQVFISYQIARGLQYLHTFRKEPLAHRDLSDNNILLSEDGKIVKICDFGQSRFCNPGQMTQAPGTLAFMPTEATTEGYDLSIDIFSLGVLMLEISTLKAPDPDLSTKADKQNLDQLERRKNDLSLLPDSHPLKPLILWCLSERKDRRPYSNAVCQLLQYLQFTVKKQERIDELQKEVELRLLHETNATEKYKEKYEALYSDMKILKQQNRLLEEKWGEDNEEDIQEEDEEDDHQYDDVVAVLPKKYGSLPPKSNLPQNVGTTYLSSIENSVSSREPSYSSMHYYRGHRRKSTLNTLSIGLVGILCDKKALHIQKSTELQHNHSDYLKGESMIAKLKESIDSTFEPGANYSNDVQMFQQATRELRRIQLDQEELMEKQEALKMDCASLEEQCNLLKRTLAIVDPVMTETTLAPKSPGPYKEGLPLAKPEVVHKLKLENVEWYWGMLSKTEVNNVMEKNSIGSFLVRDSSQHQGCFVLAVKIDQESYHELLIIPKNDGYILKHSDIKSMKFLSVIDLVDHFMKRNFDGNHLFYLTNPINKEKEKASSARKMRECIGMLEGKVATAMTLLRQWKVPEEVIRVIENPDQDLAYSPQARGKSGSDILESSKATDRGVTLELLAPVIPLIASKWAGIAKALDLCDYVSIFKDLSDMAKVKIVLQRWIEMGINVNWIILIDIFRKIQLDDAAEMLVTLRKN